MTLHGPYIIELLLYRRPAIRTMLLDAAELGCTAVGFNVMPSPLYASVRALAHPLLWQGQNLERPKPLLWKQIDHVLKLCDRTGMRPIAYGLVWPDINSAASRGLEDYFHAYRWQGRNIRLADWHAFAGDARTAWLHFLETELYPRYGDALDYVDGTETYMSAHGPSPNAISDAIASVTPSELRLFRSVGPWPDSVSDGDEGHINPGDEYTIGGHGGIIATDGWGHAPSEEFLAGTEDNPNRMLRYAALPPGQTVAEIADWYVDLLRRCKADDRYAVLVLQTAGWPFDRSTMWPRRPGRIWRKGDQPWHRIYGRMSKAA